MYVVSEIMYIQPPATNSGPLWTENIKKKRREEIVSREEVKVILLPTCRAQLRRQSHCYSPQTHQYPSNSCSIP